MYFDEDGDLAHEFYTEQRVQVKAGVVRWVMRKVTSDKLIPQVIGGQGESFVFLVYMVQWSLRTMDTLGAGLLSVVERCPYLGD